ncbi:uncharacterized protein LOC132948465 isoform X1 [Metopolophium dirhodum]|uniref:uncharacterized protein LOC132948465 isoform X1 n=1 Tax=Metopolophium dirhodum TaxID=44670 RepID=UPI00298F9787|nr:uncharacterized protein LOC132948465 isoform X1 [Metopolophium dirhodum]
MNIRVYFRNCLKAVILLWIGIIAFHSSVTSYEITGRDIRGLRLNYCGGLLKSIELYYFDKRDKGHLQDFFDFLQMPKSTLGPLKHILVPYDKSPCDKEMEQTIELPVKL